MGRQLFLHHYLPAHLASALVTGALIEFACTVDPIIDEETVNPKRKVPDRTKRAFQGSSERLKGQSMLTMWGVVGVIMAAVIWGWWFFLPLTYGKPGLSVAEVNARKWLGYDLHFAK